MRAAIPRQPFTIVNVGCGVGHSVLDVLRFIEEGLGHPIEIHSGNTSGTWLTDWVVLNNAKAREEFGWSPAVDLRSGIRGMLDGWLCESRTDGMTRNKAATVGSSTPLHTCIGLDGVEGDGILRDCQLKAYRLSPDGLGGAPDRKE